LEIEFGPAEPMRVGSQRFLTAPETVFNIGIADGGEAVLQGQAVTTLSPGPAQTSLFGNGFFLTNVVHAGVLQDKPGPSVAIEVGWNGIASYRWGWLTAQFNVAAMTWVCRDDRQRPLGLARSPGRGNLLQARMGRG
jgi:hypothetical protein